MWRGRKHSRPWTLWVLFLNHRSTCCFTQEVICQCDRMKSKTCWKIISLHGGADVFVARKQRCPVGHCGVRKHQRAQDQVISINAFLTDECVWGKRNKYRTRELGRDLTWRGVFRITCIRKQEHFVVCITTMIDCQENNAGTNVYFLKQQKFT